MKTEPKVLHSTTLTAAARRLPLCVAAAGIAYTIARTGPADNLVRRHRQLVDAAAQKKQREPILDQTLVTSSIERHVAFLAGEIAAIDQAIADAITSDVTLAHCAVLLRTIPGIGAVTVATLVAELPRLGATGNKQIAALTGVAPMNRDSSMSRGQAHILGGRMSARCRLYMARIVATRCISFIRSFYKYLRGQGKPPKVAIVAAMRKLSTTANAILAHDRPWHAVPA